MENGVPMIPMEKSSKKHYIKTEYGYKNSKKLHLYLQQRPSMGNRTFGYGTATNHLCYFGYAIFSG